MTGNDETLVEAVLFSAGKPVSAEDIGQGCGLSADRAREALKKLSGSYDKRSSAIEIVRVGSKWVMQLRPDIIPKAGKIAPMIIPKPVLKTAALIAYHQPIKQSRLMLMVGARVYEHVPFLLDMGLISAKRYSHTYILTTSTKFPEYFGIPTSRREDIKKWIADKVGIKLTVKEQKKMSKEAAEADAAAEVADAAENANTNPGTPAPDPPKKSS